MTRRYSYDPYASPNPRRFYRTPQDKVIAGVCGGIAARFGWEPLLVRILVVVATIFGLGPVAVVAYVVTWMITPPAPAGYGRMTEEEDVFWRGVSDRPRATFGNLKYTYMDLEDRLKTLERQVTDDEWRLRQEFRDLEKGN